MKRLIFAALGSVALAALAETPSDQSEPASTPFKPEWIHIHTETQVGSAYQLYGALFNDEPSWIYSASIDFDIPVVGTVGAGSWTLNDLTDRNRDYNYWWNHETDLDLHWFRSFDVAKDIALNVYAGHIWFLFFHTKGEWEPQQSFIWGIELDNPIVTPFVNFEYEYAYYPSLYVEGGLKRNFDITDSIRVVPSVSVSGMGRGFKTSFFPEPDGEYGHGIEALFARIRWEWDCFAHTTLFVQATYCSLLDPDIRDAIDNAAGSTYKKDYGLVEAGVSFNF